MFATETVKEKIYRFYVDCGRFGVLEGMILSDDNKIAEAIGKTAAFGEVLGKHSNIEVELESHMFEEVTADQDFIKKAVGYKVAPSGYDPFDYID